MYDYYHCSGKAWCRHSHSICVIMDIPIHSFHIPVLGLGYSIDTPVKVARFGISSVISIVDDQLVEKMRGFYCLQQGQPYRPILETHPDFRAKRITGYLNLVQQIVQQQMETLRSLDFDAPNELTLYFELLPASSPLRRLYDDMRATPAGTQQAALQQQLKQLLVAGEIDVNIMVKVDRMRSDADGKLLPSEYSDALAALRGFAQSNLKSAVVLSAGYNPRLYQYIDQFPDFLPDSQGQLQKKVILKVSDYRSALVQGKILAKRGVWVSEFRIESGLNCGGHAFATDGLLLGPILEEFKLKRTELAAELLQLCNATLAARSLPVFSCPPVLKVTVQGGIGTANEQAFLLEQYEVNATGWGSPFLLVPEATNVDEATLQQLANAKKEDYFMSDASPLGVPFHNLRNSSAEIQRRQRIDKGRPGSACYKKFLSSDTEFTEAPICTASRKYQHLKIKQLKEQGLTTEAQEAALVAITSKDCLCEGLGASALIKSGMPLSHNLSAVTICPGPNLAYFSGVFSLSEMIGHIYGRVNILNAIPRSHMFVNELQLYVDHFRKKIAGNVLLNPKQEKQLQAFKANLLDGIQYYKDRLNLFKQESSQYLATMKEDLDRATAVLTGTSLCVTQFSQQGLVLSPAGQNV